MASPSRSPHLLHADEEQLDRAATMLRTGTAFVIAVAPKDLWPAALGRLRAKVPGPEMPPPIEITEAWAMLDALVEQTKRKDRVLSLTLAGDVGSALDGLNLHREKTLKGGPVLLWLEGVDALMQVRERAPDAFSFRATMVMLQGDGGALPVASGEEPEEIARLRRRLKRAKTPLERASVGQALAEALRVRGRNAEAEAEARSAWSVVPVEGSEETGLVRAMLCRTLGQIAGASGMGAQRLHWILRALAENEASPHRDRVDREAMLRVDLHGFYGHDLTATQRSLELVRVYGLAPETRAVAIDAAMSVARALEDAQKARTLARELQELARHLSAVDWSLALCEIGRVESAEGHLSVAEQQYREAVNVEVGEHGSGDRPTHFLANLLIEKGEIDAALGVGRTSLDVQCKGELERGDLREARAIARRAVRAAVARHADATLMQALDDYLYVASCSGEAAPTTQDEMGQAWNDFEAADAVVQAVSGESGPRWYPVQLSMLRARLLVLAPEAHQRGVVVSRQALDLAHRTYPDLLPEAGRLLADHLLLAAQPDEALAAVADVEPYAAANGFLGERARLLSARLLAHVLRGDPPDAVAPHLAALREACAATDSPRLTAETLRDLAKRLPPTCTTPDPYALAEEAHDLFLAMPMPAQDARCMEIMGDVLLARGDRDGARGRYQMARGRLQRYGLGLRLPLLEKKLAALA